MSKFNELEPRLKSSKNWFQLKQSWNNEYDFKWNEPYLSRGLNLGRGSNSLNSASGKILKKYVNNVSLKINLSWNPDFWVRNPALSLGMIYVRYPALSLGMTYVRYPALSLGMIYVRYPASSLGMIFLLDIRLQVLAYFCVLTLGIFFC